MGINSFGISGLGLGFSVCGSVLGMGVKLQVTFNHISIHLKHKKSSPKP